jgi:hypothetical protein
LIKYIDNIKKGGIMIGYVDSRIDPNKAVMYQDWINSNVPADGKKVIGSCVHYSKKMVERFPELRLVGIQDLFEGHCWCFTEDNLVVDPTAHQYDNGFCYPNDPLEEEDFPTGKCIWCGEMVIPDTNRAREWFGADMVGPHHECDRLLMEDLNSI